jgi:hypothetical protein
MAPEQMEKPTTVDHRADIFSLGVVFYEMLTGELPLGKFGPPSSRKVEVDVRLDDVVLRTLEKDPERRYQHASQVKSAVDTIAGTAAPPPRAPAVDAAALAQEILARDYALNVRSCVRRGWKLLKGEFWPFVGITALFIALLGAASSFGGASFTHESGGDSVLKVGSVVATLVWGPMMGGLLFYFLKKLRHEPATVETAFCGFSPRFLHLFLAGFATSMLTWLGFVCLIVPGIYLLVAWMFTLPIVMDKQVDFWSAMELSRKVVTKHWFKLFGLGLMMWLLICAGVLALVLGVLVMAPLILAALMYAYEDIFGGATGTAPAPAAAATGPTGTIVMPVASAPAARGARWTPAVKIGLAGVVLVVLLAIIFPLVRNHLRFDLGPAAQALSAAVETTPVATPAAAPAASEAPMMPPAATPAPAFAPVVELELTNLAAVNLASGERKSVPQYLADQILSNGKDMAIVGWMDGSEMDFAYVDGSSYSMLAGQADLPRESWDQADPGTVASALQKTGKDIGGKFEGTGSNSPTNFTYGFQTRSGRTGLLQIVEFANASPPAVKIRYKLVELAAAAGAAISASPQVLEERLEAASGIIDAGQKDKPLAGVARDAAKAGQVDIARKALAAMIEMSERDAATHDAALLLAKRELRRAAVEMANGISDTDLRDQTLSALAQ